MGKTHINSLKYVLVFCLSPSTITTGTINIAGIGDIDYQAKWQSVSVVGANATLPALMCHTSYYIMVMNGLNYTFNDIGVAQAENTHKSTYPTSSHSVRTYVPGSHERYLTGFWSVDVCNTTWYGAFLNNNSYLYAANPAFLVKFLQPFVKANTHTMSFTIKTSWGRS